MWRPPRLPSPEQALAETLHALADQYDFVLVDSPAVLAVTDPRIVAAHVDAVLLVVRMTGANRQRAQRAREILEEGHARLVGTIINAAGRPTDFRHYGYNFSPHGLEL